jgi:hypothetical protein
MSYLNYTQYLGANKCCNLKSQGPIGPIGPTGPAAVGPIGPTGPGGINTTITTLSLPASSSTLTLPAQSSSIAYYTLILYNGNNVSNITFNSFPVGGLAEIFITYGDALGNATISNIITHITYLNYTSSQSLSPTIPAGILRIQNAGGSIYYGTFEPFYSNI